MVKFLITLENKATNLRLWILHIHNMTCMCIYRYNSYKNMYKILSQICKHKPIYIYIYISFMHVSLMKSHDHAVQKVKKRLSSEGFWLHRLEEK